MPQTYSGDGDHTTIGAKSDAPAQGSGGKASVVSLLKGLLSELSDEEGDSEMLTELRGIRIGLEKLNHMDDGDLLALARAARPD